MNISKERAFDVLEKISFERVAGSIEELKCANIIKEECKKAGVDVSIEEFEIDTPEILVAKFKVTKPVEYEFNCIGIGKSGVTNDEGISAPLCYVEDGMDANLLDVKGKIILLTGGKPEMLEKAQKAGALGYIQVHGSLFDTTDMIRELRTRNEIKKAGEGANFPGIVIHISDAQKLLRMNPEEVNIVLKQDANKKSFSHNVIATIEGTEKTDENIVFSAHYDSVIYSSGAWDNGTGAITIMEIMHYFLANKPKRTLKFVWCGSEEIGLVGSKSYCEKHFDELEKCLLNINVDMTGTLLGSDIAVCSCEDSAAKFIYYLGKIEGFPIKTKVDIYSSDSSSFAINGVPAITFARMAPRGGAEIHSRKDIIDHLDPNKFIQTVEFMIKFASLIINARVFPIAKELPKELNDKLEQFKKFDLKVKKNDSDEKNRDKVK